MFHLFKKTTPEPVDDTSKFTDNQYENLLQAIVEEKVPQPKQSKQAFTLSKQEVLDYLAEREGEEINYSDVADATGFSVGYVSVLITHLMKSKHLKRSGVRGKYVFQVNKAKVRKPRRKSEPVMTLQTSEVKQTKGEQHKQTLLDYIRRHEDQPMTQEKIANMVNLNQATVSRALRELEADRVIVRSVSVRGDGCRYWLMESTVLGPNQEVKAQDVENPMKKLKEHVDKVAWEYMAEEKNADLVGFLAYLDKK